MSLLASHLCGDSDITQPYSGPPSITNDHDHCSNDADEHSHSDAESNSSSVKYSHEPFEEFRLRVQDFAQSHWHSMSMDDIVIRRMKGGSFNRIIGISIPSLSIEEPNDFILRIPRFNAARLDRDVAALRFVRRLGTIPVAEISFFDKTRENKLGHPYMIQKRIQGDDLYSTFPQLTHESKCKFATEFGEVFRHMLLTQTTRAGVFALASNANENEGATNDIDIAPFYEAETFSPQEYLAQTTLQLLTLIFETRKQDNLNKYPTDNVRPSLFDQFILMASEMDAFGLLKDIKFSLYHADLAPRNILVNDMPNDEHKIITGILDWDSAASAPCFMSCAPPLWLWGWKDDEDEDERTAGDIPPTEE